MFFFLFFAFGSFESNIDKSHAPEMIKVQFLSDLEKVKVQAIEFNEILEAYSLNKARKEGLRQAFIRLKESYKRIEFLVEYLDPELGEALNGAPIPHVKIDNEHYQALKFSKPAYITVPPEGLQVLEEIIFAEPVEPSMADQSLPLIFRFSERLNGFANGISTQPLAGKQIIESIREQTIRAVTLGITGFDTPEAINVIEHTAVSLEPIGYVLNSYKPFISGRAKNEFDKAVRLFENMNSYLRENTDFDSFDRLYFIRELADPAYGALTALQHLIVKQNKEKFTNLSKPVNDFSKSLFDENFLLPHYYSKQTRGSSDTKLVVLGKLLFFDPILSSNTKRSCAGCHVPSKAFADGRTKSIAFDFRGEVKRNAPTLLNSIFSTAYFWDSRVEYIQDQIADVISNPAEIHGSYEDITQKLNQSNEYKKLFMEAYPKEKDAAISANTVNRAIAAYVQSLVALNSPFDRYMRRETSELDNSVARGFNLFMGKAACGTCHFAPVFNGIVPPRYIKTESEVLGTTASADLELPVLDEDFGRAGIVGSAALNHSFKTPTVRNAELTAPYMHNGAFSTLEEVMDFYDMGGGAGLNLDVPNQTLPSEALNLTEDEKKDIIAFMKSLTDPAFNNDIPEKLPAFNNNPELNKRVVGGEY